MNEKEFWGYLERLWKESGRANAVIGTVDCADSQGQDVGKYLQGHALLPKDYDRLCPGDIMKIGSLLFQKDVSHPSKEAVMVLLAHQPSEVALTILAKYNLHPDQGLEFFARMALEECAMWNE
jgi:hypothetical protein